MRLKSISTILLLGALMLVACRPAANVKVEEDLQQSEGLVVNENNYLLPGLDHGLLQSPINILSEEATTGGHSITLKFTGEINKVQNLGHTVQLDLDSGNTISMDGRTFEFKQMHFHTPSEHLIDGITYPMEMHVVTTLKDQPDGEITEYLVLAFLVRMGKENKFISNFIDQIPKEEDSINEIDLNALTDSETSNVADLLKELNSYYHYKGSLTTPPYTESVNWYVMKKIFEASPEQILRINSIVGDNSRHIQARSVDSEPSLSLGIATVPNLRDLGGYTTNDGAIVVSGLVYRSNQLAKISPEDMKKFAELGLKNDYDLRTEAERTPLPDELPPGVNNIWLDVLKDAKGSAPTNLLALLQNPEEGNKELGDGKIEAIFITSYRDFVSLSSAKTAYHELFTSLADENKLPALFHCTTGKDRTGWAAAALLTLLDVPKETIMKDYLRSNDYILPLYKEVIDAFVDGGGAPTIPQAIFGVKEEYLEASFDEMQTKYGTIENYFSEGLGIDATTQNALRDMYLTNE